MQSSSRIHRFIRAGAPLAIGLLALLSFSGQATAASLLPNTIQVISETAGVGSISADALGCINVGRDLFSCAGGKDDDSSGDVSITGQGWELTVEDLALDLDPSISADFSFLNTSAITQTFVITFSIPVNITAPASNLGGSVGITVTDANNNGLGGTSTVFPTAFYTGIIDGSLVPGTGLFDHPSSLNYAFAGQSVVVSDFFGLPGNTVPGPAFSNDIGIFFRFSLSPGDRIGVTAVFNVEPAVPEPATALLIAGGLIGLLGLRRRLTR